MQTCHTAIQKVISFQYIFYVKNVQYNQNSLTNAIFTVQYDISKEASYWYICLLLKSLCLSLFNKYKKNCMKT